jgi:glycosyltransferase involved in cell wall biosynthesis
VDRDYGSVVFTSYHADLGGGELRLLEYLGLTRIPRARLSVVLCEPGPFVGRIQALGIPTTLIRWNRAARRPWRTVQTALASIRLHRHLRQRRARVLFCNTYNDLLLGGPIARRAGIPVIWRSHADVFPYADEAQRQVVARFVAGHVAHVLTTTDYDRRLIVEAGLPAERVSVVRLGVDIDLYTDPDGRRRRQIRADLGVGAHTPLVGFVARLVPQKGHLVFLEALARVAAKRPEIRALVVGDAAADGSDPSGYRRRVQQAVQDLGLSDHVIFTGFSDDVPGLLAAMDVFVHASLREPFGSVIVEAMASGKPVIASQTLGPEEIIADGITGLLTPPGDVASLANAMLRVLDDRDLSARLAGEGQAMVRARYDLRQTIADLDRHLIEVAERRR